MRHSQDYPTEEHPSGQYPKEQYQREQYPMGQRTTGFQMTEEHQRAITDLFNCNSIIQETLMHCLQMGGKHVEPRHVGLMLDTAELCKTGTSVLFHSSELSGRFLGVIGEACNLCASSCDQFGDDARMKACADACRRTAESCRKISGSRI